MCPPASWCPSMTRIPIWSSFLAKETGILDVDCNWCYIVLSFDPISDLSPLFVKNILLVRNHSCVSNDTSTPATKSILSEERFTSVIDLICLWFRRKKHRILINVPRIRYIWHTHICHELGTSNLWRLLTKILGLWRDSATLGNKSRYSFCLSYSKSP